MIEKQKKILLVLVMLLGSQFCVVAAKGSQNKPTSDVRVLVDISGSMKVNDPNNLRIPAIQLMSNLLPPDSQAGVWTFGQYVNMLVPLRIVDKTWKKLAISQAKKINSAGLYTNIGGAMEKAFFGWKSPDPSIKRSLILLTDGVVDVSKDVTVNAVARRKILRELLPQFKAAGITIHTIALSAEADEKLLSTMAAETDGWYQQVSNASDLQKVFLKIFEQATERDSVPLNDNKFTIDKDIEEFTLLVFKKKGSKPIVLEQPDGEDFDASADGSGVFWFESADYDLITISSPLAGEWRVHADIDPDNRVLVVSNLKLKSTSLPNNLLANEKFTFNMYLLQEGEMIDHSDFLKLLTMHVELKDASGNEVFFEVFDNGEGVDEKSGDGIYSIALASSSVAGITQISAWVESPTFQRMRQQATNIYESPVSVSQELSEDTSIPHKLFFTPEENVVKSYSLLINVVVNLPNGKAMSAMAEFDSGYTQVIELPVIVSGGQYQVQLDITGETPAGRHFQVRPPAYHFMSKPIISAVEEILVDTIDEKPVEENDRMFWIMVAIAVNVLLIVLGWLLNKLMKKKRVVEAKKLSEQLE